MLTDGTWTYTWEHGRELVSMTGENIDGGENDVTINYQYNADGLRTKKTVTTNNYGEERTLESTIVEEYSYVYNGSNLVRLDIKTTTTLPDGGGSTLATSYLNFYYDTGSTPMAVDWNGSLFYYTTNLQGDVTGLTASDGTSVVQYTYDAWGNILTVINTHTRAIISCGYYLYLCISTKSHRFRS